MKSKRTNNYKQQVLAAAALIAVVLSVLLLNGPGMGTAQAAPPAAVASLPSCGWIAKTNGTGVTNVAYPDTSATYWSMAIDTTQWKAVILRGVYPNARFFSFVTYDATGASHDSLTDTDIDPNPRSSNPFRRGPQSKFHNYTVTITKDPPQPGEKNHIQFDSSTALGWIIYRIYVPDSGLTARGGVPLPQVTLVDNNGVEHSIPKCPFQKPLVQLLLLLAELRANGFVQAADYWQSKFFDGDSLGLPTDANCQPDNQIVFWIPKNTGAYFPNPANKYIAAPGLCFEKNRVIVVRAKAAVYPDTYNHKPIWIPAIPGLVQMRYWSMCNNVQHNPAPVVQCAADHATALDKKGYYTYVLGAGDKPSWLGADETWLPWGTKAVPNILIFRNMLPSDNFTQTVQAAIAAGCVVDNQPNVTPDRQDVINQGNCAHNVMGKFYPQTASCDAAVLQKGSWRACFKAAGIEAE